MSNIHICDLSTKIRLGFQVYTTGYMEPFSRLLVSLFEINIWEWLKGITQPRVQTSRGVSLKINSSWDRIIF